MAFMDPQRLCRALFRYFLTTTTPRRCRTATHADRKHGAQGIEDTALLTFAGAVDAGVVIVGKFYCPVAVIVALKHKQSGQRAVDISRCRFFAARYSR